MKFKFEKCFIRNGIYQCWLPRVGKNAGFRFKKRLVLDFGFEKNTGFWFSDSPRQPWNMQKREMDIYGLCVRSAAGCKNDEEKCQLQRQQCSDDDQQHRITIYNNFKRKYEKKKLKKIHLCELVACD